MLNFVGRYVTIPITEIVVLFLKFKTIFSALEPEPEAKITIFFILKV